MALKNARVDIAKYSLPQAASCITLAQRKRNDLNEDMDADAELDWGLKQEGIFIGGSLATLWLLILKTWKTALGYQLFKWHY